MRRKRLTRMSKACPSTLEEAMQLWLKNHSQYIEGLRGEPASTRPVPDAFTSYTDRSGQELG